jgi:pterin-4a-carbinolamine dehydratase
VSSILSPNRELVGHFRVPDLPGVVMAVTAALGLAETWNGHARVEVSDLEVVVHFTTPAAGGVTRNDFRLADRFSEHQRRFARPADRRTALQKTAGMWKDRDDLPDFEALRREWER